VIVTQFAAMMGPSAIRCSLQHRRSRQGWCTVPHIRAAVPFSQLPTAAASNAPTPGAILLGSSDISTANGLDPDSLERAMNQTRPIVETPRPSVGDLPVPLPVLDRA